MSTVYTDDYTKTTYRNDNPPALDQTNLNNSENGIKTLSGRVATLSSELSAEVSARNSAISSAVSAEALERSNADKSINRSLDYLWKLSKGVVYDEEEVTSYASDVTVPSGAKEYASMDILGGMSRKGKNLLNPTLQTTTVNGVTIENLGNGTYRLNGIVTADTSTLTFETLALKKGTYKLTCCPSGASGYYVALNNSGRGGVESGSGAIISVASDSSNYRFYPIIMSGTVLNDVVLKPMLTLDTSATYSDYEPYTSSLIDAKADKVVSEGANRLQSSDFVVGEYINNSGDTASAGVNTRATNHEYIDISSMTTAYVSFHNGTNYSLIYATYDGDKKLITRSAISTNKKEHTIATNGAKYLRICPFADTDLTGVDFKCVVSSVSTTDYSPYVKHETTLPTSVTSLDGYGIGINNTCYNYLEYTGDKVYFHKKVGSVDLGSFNWEDIPNFDACDRYVAEVATSLHFKRNSKGLCSRFTYISSGTSTIGYICLNVGTQIGVNYATKGTTNLSQFKADIDGVMLYYELAEEVVTDVSSYFSLDSEILSVEPYGKVTFHYADIDTYDVDVPNKITYIVDVSEVTE